MGEQAKKAHISAGLLAHVGAFSQEPQTEACIPGSKTGGFSFPAEVKLF